MVKGSYRPILGSLPEIASATTYTKANAPNLSSFSAMITRSSSDLSSPIHAINIGNTNILVTADPTCVRDLFITKNQGADKTGYFQAVLFDLLGDSFLFAPNDAAWKHKRKVCSQAFYQEKMREMFDTMKLKTSEMC